MAWLQVPVLHGKIAHSYSIQCPDVGASARLTAHATTAGPAILSPTLWQRRLSLSRPLTGGGRRAVQYLFRSPYLLYLLYLLQRRTDTDYKYNTIILTTKARIEGRRADENSGLVPRDIVGAVHDFRSRRQKVGGCNRRWNKE